MSHILPYHIIYHTIVYHSMPYHSIPYRIIYDISYIIPYHVSYNIMYHIVKEIKWLHENHFIFPCLYTVSVQIYNFLSQILNFHWLLQQLLSTDGYRYHYNHHHN